ncbi:MAG: hypothetical protein Ta2F_13570 [Termitinemataceae bacterium]|nr:MAG: hypothetical protein Ta2F_13570 [Termitinemataceae bacterium]
MHKISFFVQRSAKLCFLLPLFLCFFALGDFLAFGKDRRTCVYYSLDGKRQIVEERLLPRTDSKEAAISEYVEDLLLGPASLQEAPLINQGAVINLLMLREGVVFLDMSQEAAIPPAEGGDVLRNLEAVKYGIRRNFPYVKEVKIFIDGNESGK